MIAASFMKCHCPVGFLPEYPSILHIKLSAHIAMSPIAIALGRNRNPAFIEWPILPRRMTMLGSFHGIARPCSLAGAAGMMVRAHPFTCNISRALRATSSQPLLR